MIIFGALCCIFGYQFIQRSKEKKQHQLAQKIYSETFILLNRSKQICLRGLVSQFENKYGKGAVKRAWPLVEDLRVADGKVLIFKDEFQGSYEIFWSI